MMLMIITGLYLSGSFDIDADDHSIQETAENEEKNENLSSLTVSQKTDNPEKNEETVEISEEILAEEETKQEQSVSSSPATSETKTGHYEERQELVRESWDEKVLVKKESCESVLVKDAWDEEVWEDGAWYGSDTVEAKVCNGCGEIFYGSISEHMSEHPDHGGWHNEMIPQGDPYWHGSKTIIHHDAVYETRCEPDEYTTVHHEAKYRTVIVWIEE